jgi:DNA-binding transcriptional LysR family regulator
MRTFVGVAQEESFAAAARTVGLSRALVSRHIADLERKVGMPLVVRTTRSVSLTEAGHRYLAFAKRILAEIDAENDAIIGVQSSAACGLSVVSPKWIGGLDLGDAIATFAMEHPRTHVRLELDGMSEPTSECLQAGYDIAFHTKMQRDRNVRIRRIAMLQFVLCASPNYLRAHDPISRIVQLSTHSCLVHTNDATWRFADGGVEQCVAPANIAFTSNTYMVLQKAAMAGMGLALLPLRSIVNEVRSGKLQLIVGEWTPPDRVLYAAYSRGTPAAKKVRTFLDFIEDWFDRHPMEC